MLSLGKDALFLQKSGINLSVGEVAPSLGAMGAPAMTGKDVIPHSLFQEQEIIM